ncbi:MAG: 4Fe-4S dicluster domain-containing protein [Actinomycetes bacterium]|jgi:heterodisulfide reductase subunit B|nr:4Fe-4S dicluster domain-containing protein [Actinomycetes bacterium]
MAEYAVFWGCTIPARFPFIEKATRLMADDLSCQLRDGDGFTCCPEGTLVKANSPEAFNLTAARNLALVEREGLDLITPCNGCYSTFKETQSHLATDWRERDAINERLATVDLRYDGRLTIYHLAEYLADVVGIGAVAARVTRPLWGMRIAVHYGCHLLRPQPAVRWDDALHPTKVEALVKSLGATVVDYPSKMVCCGGALGRVGEMDSSMAFARKKLNELKEAQVDALVVVCPSCFQQFDLNQAALSTADDPQQLPVFYLSELVALAYGHSPEELGFAQHRTSVTPFLERLDRAAADKEHLARHFDVALLNKCDDCRACKDDCPVAKIDPTFRPNDMIADLVRGRMDEVVASAEAYKCVECYNCQELCHSRIGMTGVMRSLKELGIARGQAPAAVISGYEAVLHDGVLGKPRMSARKKLGLGEVPTGGGNVIEELMAAGRTSAEKPAEQPVSQ